MFCLSIAINILAKKMKREERIPFEVPVDPFYTKSDLETLRRSADQLGEGKIIAKTMGELEEMVNG